MHSHAIFAVLVVGTGIAVTLPSARNAAFAQTAALTALDYVEIQQLVNRLNFALDYCTNGGQDFANLFVEGGEYTIDEGGDSAPRTLGSRQQLIELAGGPSCDSRRSPPSAYILHLAESLVIEPTPEGARGTSYAIYPSSKGRFFADDVAGQLGLYHDEYVKTTDGWRLRSRRHETSPIIGEVEL